MPIFEFQCNKCHTDFEELLQDSKAKVSCPICYSSDVSKKFSTFARTGGASEFGGTSSGSSCTGCSATNCGSCGS